jgi:DNA-binding Lrp family transcriptional regulator
MTQIDKIARVLAKNNRGSGITVARIADRAGVSKDSVYKRVHDLRNEGFTIYSNYRTVNGQRKLYYRMSGTAN